MQIQVVLPGQTLYGIAGTYGVTVPEIARANQINPNETLVVGQALVIPIVGSYHYVAPGETLYLLGRRFGLPAAELARVNNLPVNGVLRVGQRIYLPDPPRVPIEVNAYAERSGGAFSPGVLGAVRENAPELTYLAPFSFEAKADGSLATFDVSPLREAAAGSGAVLMMVVTNLENGAFSDTLGQTILNNPAVQNTLLDNIVRTAKAENFRDVHFDFEFLRPQDREAYNAFLRKASARLHAEGLLMSTALAPKTSASQTGAWYTAHDYRTHGEVADFVVIMTYEWGYSGGPPMPVSPIGPVRRVLEYAKTEIPPEKIMMGQNLYGYDWTLPYVPGGPFARAISPQAAIRLARDSRQAILYDYTAHAPFFRYWDSAGREHIVWFEDARSIDAKFKLLKELGLRGISYWKLGLPFPQNWELLTNRFQVVKK